jgi:hypothetical protein
MIDKRKLCRFVGKEYKRHVRRERAARSFGLDEDARTALACAHEWAIMARLLKAGIFDA